MRALRRPVALGVAACLLWAAGCYSGLDYAHESSLRLSAGMTMDEVEARLGPPALIVRGDPGTETVWFYRYEGGPNVVCTVFLVVFFVVLLVALVAAGGGGGGGWGGGSWGDGSDGPPAQIKLRFDPDGYLVDVSPPHAVPQ